MSKKGLFEALSVQSSKKTVKYAVYLTAVAAFFALILVPPILGIVIKWNSIQDVSSQPVLVARAWDAVRNSFAIALFVSFLDIVTGIPMAWLITRRQGRLLSILDTLADVPFIVPTAALGYSLLLFWNKPEGLSSLFGGSIASQGWLMIILLHFTFSYPVVVRVVVGALLDYKKEFENAARTLSAPPFTAARTVTFPIMKPSLIAAFILAFSRSISETGATLMVAGAFENGSVFIQNMKTDYLAGIVSQKTYEGSTVFASFILIAISLTIFLLIRALGTRLKLPGKQVWPTFERKISYSGASSARDGSTLVIFLAIVLVPSLFVALPAFSALFTPTLSQAVYGTGVWGSFWQGLILSYLVATVVTILNIVMGLPVAIIIARKKFGTLPSAALDLLVNVPLIIPSIAVGVSLAIFWKENFGFMPEIILLILAHLAITYPYFVKSMSAAVERVGIDLEDASRTLGARPLHVFRTIILPLTKYSIVSGAIMVFTRSISETGATVAVTSALKTAPVVIVDWVRPKGLPTATPLEIGLGCGFLILFSFAILLGLRLVIKGKGRY